MSTVGSNPQASACTAWARPISPPPGHTAALLDMFCDLKGATRTPARENARHSAVTTTLLPTSEAVPMTIKLLALMSFPTTTLIYSCARVKLQSGHTILPNGGILAERV